MHDRHDRDERTTEIPTPPQPARGDWDALVRLCVQASPLSMSHWNPRTGEIFTLTKGRDRQARAEAFQQRLFSEDDWIEVPCLESADGYALAEAFANSLSSGRGKQAVQQALAGPKPFRALRQVLAQAPGLDRRYEKMVREEAELRLAELCLGLELLHPDPRFTQAAERLGQADGPDMAEEAGPFELTTPCAVPVSIRRSIAVLSIGMRAHEA